MLGQGVTDIAFIPIVFLTNTISYARLGIFLIIHSALMGFVNGAWSYGILGLPMIILGNIAVMVMEGFLVYIQDLRLHLYEWLTKFTDDVGDSRLFTPIKSDSELVEIRFTLNECNGCHANYDVNKQPMLEVLSP
jgi:V/A-type H+-transporting ATPase subunit I